MSEATGGSGADARGPGPGAPWRVVVLTACGIGLAGALNGAAVVFLDLSGARFWLYLSVCVVVGGMVGGAVGMVLRRRRGLATNSTSRFRALTWRQRWSLRWATERARAPADPVVAAAAVERLERQALAYADLSRWMAVATRATVWVTGVVCALVAPLLILLGWLRDEPGNLWVGLGAVVFGVLVAVGLPWMTRGMMGWGERRLARTLDACRVAATRRAEARAE